MRYPDIKITKEELSKIIYFILMKFKGDPLHLQGTSSKRDFIGGYIERWVNKVAETAIFKDLLKSKSYETIPDYFVYGNDSEKNAPDILGLEKNGKIIPFTKYKDGKWIAVDGMPRIEVKVFRKDQALVGVREPQMIDDYYVFVESDLEPDYLTAVFEDDIFSERYFDQLEMPSELIESDIENQIISHAKMSKNKEIGKLRLLGIYSREEVKQNTVLCGKGVKPYYFSSASNAEVKRTDSEELQVDKNGLFTYEMEEGVYLPVLIRGAEGEKIKISKKNKGSVYFYSPSDVAINGIECRAGMIKIEYKKFDRSSSWDENIASKYIVENNAKDCTEELISFFDKIAK
jgi:hypothetical protein